MSWVRAPEPLEPEQYAAMGCLSGRKKKIVDRPVRRENSGFFASFHQERISNKRVGEKVGRLRICPNAHFERLLVPWLKSGVNNSFVVIPTKYSRGQPGKRTR